MGPSRRFDEVGLGATYRRNVLLMLLALTAGFGPLFVWLNLRLYDYRLAAIEALVTGYALLLIPVARRTARLTAVTLAFLLPFFAVMLCALVSPVTDPSVFCWVLMVPLLTHLLLGRWLGLAIGLAVLAASAALFFARYGEASALININSLANVLLCAAAVIGFSQVYEIGRERQDTRLRDLAYTDPLTGLGNRARFHHLFQTAIHRAQRNGPPVALLIADIDEFKRINDDHGHVAGDRALRFVAAIVRGAASDTRHVCRIGGEEFGILLTGDDAANAPARAESLRERLAATPWLHDHDVRQLTLSIGVARYGHDARDLRSLFAQADKRLYRAKAAGRNRVVSEDIDPAASGRHSAERVRA
ncbi:GGDEF domain-containing protein [Salinisphaera sp. T31B1]|uniref:GGDEF domain-containing protein n=1 Tax=Salinisphaera sp. T31B1 TaxID=727963 RepID=UPI003341B15A